MWNFKEIFDSQKKFSWNYKNILECTWENFKESRKKILKIWGNFRKIKRRVWGNLENVEDSGETTICVNFRGNFFFYFEFVLEKLGTSFKKIWKNINLKKKNSVIYKLFYPT